jgi:OmpA-OmpF porin, OOP family
MSPTSKILIGAIATASLATISHIVNARGFIDTLGEKAAIALNDSPGIATKMAVDGAMRRGVILSGPVSDAAGRDALLTKAKAVPGMSWAKWDDGQALAAAPKMNADQTPAAPAAVKACQDGVNAAIAGKVVQFDSGAATIKPESQPLIDQMAAIIGGCAGTRVEVAGHTDLTGGSAPNQRLSEARANAVVEALVTKGVPVARLIPKGYGETKPLDPTISATADAKNRRIEFAVATAS